MRWAVTRLNAGRHCWGIYRYPWLVINGNEEKWNVVQVDPHVHNKLQKVRSDVGRSCFFLPDLAGQIVERLEDAVGGGGGSPLCDPGAVILRWNLWANVTNSCERGGCKCSACMDTHVFTGVTTVNQNSLNGFFTFPFVGSEKLTRRHTHEGWLNLIIYTKLPTNQWFKGHAWDMKAHLGAAFTALNAFDLAILLHISIIWFGMDMFGSSWGLPV